MTDQFFEEWLEKAKKVAVEAGEKILEVYNSDSFGEEIKADKSPLTKADKESHNAIVAVLDQSELPVLSEEGKNISYEDRKDWEYFWMVDPLDGTKEFIKRNGEFTVNIALIHKNTSILGVVYVPVTGKMYWALKGKGAFTNENGGEATALNCATFTDSDENLKIIGSRSHMNEETQDFIAKYNNPEIVSMGSSLKFMLLAEGKAHIYPRIAPTMEWDTAAAHIVVEEAGGTVKQFGKEESVVYNKANLLNPYFVAKGNLE
ncbi:3'(2'),5'-bisphosphate nucleotidase CysQ [Chondrinema litorale]|uniref:3'(2'),5'-bisphosphate nucleotidase CysQ n=1 Tax=Chondrinema litorale TaxID=2994555 RepID=UPI002543B261|nr:3'(2'),5'-bisphosphate nucleotidase CysQ [Chondrinema litorale]UZS00170.1 3'(2'),5'-bisphosphate nucleotidase CysQ [Chondrinema litorale]